MTLSELKVVSYQKLIGQWHNLENYSKTEVTSTFPV